jgi:homoaconitase/3-isopropylmalate dehydratase large subunit
MMLFIQKFKEYDVYQNVTAGWHFPILPENTRPISEAADVTLDQVVIGSCTNGRIEDSADRGCHS